MKITVLAIGKIKARAISEIVLDYAKRIAHYLPFEIGACRGEKQALGAIDKRDFFIVLDERGKQKTSKELAEFIANHQMKGAKRMVFFIGGEEGISAQTKARANELLSLSKMTFPHELVQAIVLEQIYRALTILKREPYHR